jgi:hypothetical protein
MFPIDPVVRRDSSTAGARSTARESSNRRSLVAGHSGTARQEKPQHSYGEEFLFQHLCLPSMYDVKRSPK